MSFGTGRFFIGGARIANGSKQTYGCFMTLSLFFLLETFRFFSDGNISPLKPFACRKIFCY